MRALRVSIGDRVSVSAGHGRASFLVVGRAVLNSASVLRSE
jgi:hypothetical protein